ncbi:MAG: radical SAM protein [Smithella sp.]
MLENADSLTCLHPPKDFNPADLSLPRLKAKKWEISSLALDLSGQCNLRCSYCAEAATMPRRKPMTAEVLRRALQFFFQNLSKGAVPSLRFGSGEPLLAAPLLEQCAIEAQRLSSKYHLAPPQFFLTTNGTLLNEKILRLLSTPGWYAKLSLDGPPHVHDAYRKDGRGQGTSQKVIDAVNRLCDALGDRLSITAVLSSGTDPAEVFEFCESLNVAQIELLPVAGVRDNASFTHDDLRRYRSFVAGYANDLTHGRKRAELSRFCNMLPRAMGFGVQRYRCGAGRSLYAAGPDGVLYPCFRMIGVPDCEVGSVSSQLEKHALYHFRTTAGRSFMKRSACRDCWAQALCNGPCFAITGLMNIRPGGASIQCIYSRIDATEAIRLVSKLQRSNPERLLTYLPADLSPVI